MIIRSLSRKSPSFRQLFFYMNREKDVPYFVSWNLNLVDHLDHQRILNQFYENAELLKTRKNGNYLYHEIISIKYRADVSLDRQMKALHDLSRKYIQSRGQNLLSYGRMHVDAKSLHMHVMFSANELNKSSRHRLSHQQFATIQRQCEQYFLQTYPELKQPVIYLKDREQKPNKSRQREYEFTKRTGKKTQKQQVKEQLEDLFFQDRNKSLKQHLKEHGFELYQRGKHHGVIYEGKKYRMITLGLTDEFLASKRRGYDSVLSPPEPELNHTTTNPKSNMNKLYEQMKAVEALRNYEYSRRASMAESLLKSALKEKFIDVQFNIHREDKIVYVEIFDVIRSIDFSSIDLGDFPLGDSEDYILNRREREVRGQLDRLVADLDLISQELASLPQEDFVNEQPEAEWNQPDSSPDNNEPELDL